MSAFYTYCPPGSYSEISGPHDTMRLFHVALVRGDNGRHVSQALRKDYGEAILWAEKMAWFGTPVVDAVSDPAAPFFDPRRCQ